MIYIWYTLLGVVWGLSYVRYKRRMRNINKTADDRKLILERVGTFTASQNTTDIVDSLFWTLEMDMVDFNDHLQAYHRGDNPWDLYPPRMVEGLDQTKSSEK